MCVLIFKCMCVVFFFQPGQVFLKIIFAFCVHLLLGVVTTSVLSAISCPDRLGNELMLKSHTHSLSVLTRQQERQLCRNSRFSSRFLCQSEESDLPAVNCENKFLKLHSS